jgi:hypothetical protein
MRKAVVIGSVATVLVLAIAARHFWFLKRSPEAQVNRFLAAVTNLTNESRDVAFVEMVKAMGYQRKPPRSGRELSYASYESTARNMDAPKFELTQQVGMWCRGGDYCLTLFLGRPQLNELSSKIRDHLGPPPVTIANMAFWQAGDGCVWTDESTARSVHYVHGRIADVVAAYR